MAGYPPGSRNIDRIVEEAQGIPQEEKWGAQDRFLGFTKPEILGAIQNKAPDFLGGFIKKPVRPLSAYTSPTRQQFPNDMSLVEQMQQYAAPIRNWLTNLRQG